VSERVAVIVLEMLVIARLELGDRGHELVQEPAIRDALADGPTPHGRLP